jgi:hypothetical protein
MPTIRTFASGATRNPDSDKLDYEGFLSPAVIERYAEYMHKHRVQEDGTLRASDNWQKGLPQEECMKSLWRHMMDVWKIRRGLPTQESKEDALCAVIFNAMTMLHEELKFKLYEPEETIPLFDEFAHTRYGGGAIEQDKQKE